MCCKLGSFLSVLGGFLQALGGCFCQHWCRFCADKTEACSKMSGWKLGQTASLTCSLAVFHPEPLLLFLHPPNRVFKTTTITFLKCCALCYWSVAWFPPTSANLFGLIFSIHFNGDPLKFKTEKNSLNIKILNETIIISIQQPQNKTIWERELTLQNWLLLCLIRYTPFYICWVTVSIMR